MPFDRSWLFPFPQKLTIIPKKKNCSTMRCIWIYLFWYGVPNRQILNEQVVKSHLFTSLQNTDSTNMVFRLLAHSDECYILLILIPELTPVLQLESKSGFNIVTHLATTGEGPHLHIYRLCWEDPIYATIVADVKNFVLRSNLCVPWRSLQLFEIPRY